METVIFRPRPAALIDPRFRRQPVRPIEHQPADFAEQFDDHTLLFDSIFCGSDEVLIVAPPFREPRHTTIAVKEGVNIPNEPMSQYRSHKRIGFCLH